MTRGVKKEANYEKLRKRCREVRPIMKFGLAADSCNKIDDVDGKQLRFGRIYLFRENVFSSCGIFLVIIQSYDVAFVAKLLCAIE